MVGIVLLMAATASGGAGDNPWTEEGEGYRISVLIPDPACTDPALFALLSEYTHGQVEGFRNSFKEYGGDGFEEPMDWILEITATTEPSPEGLACAMVQAWEYTGGAHGNSWSRAFVVDAGTGLEVAPSCLFDNTGDFTRFAEAVKTELIESLGEEFWIAGGSAASDENYRSLLPVPDETGRTAGYRVVFDPYQVAPYAFGPQEVFLPVDF
jgi:hypothetical protein